MELTYYLFLLSFLGFPIVALIIANNTKVERLFKFKKLIIALFVIHNLLFWVGLSLKGDYIDYFIFSFEYFVFCLIAFLLKGQTNLWTRLFRLVSLIGISLLFVFGLVGILLFIIISMDYETDKIFRFISKDKTYETRRYAFGFATTSDTRYTFETYRTFGIFPIEYKIDKTDFFDTKTNLRISESQLKIEILSKNNKEQIRFISTNGNQFIKPLK